MSLSLCRASLLLLVLVSCSRNPEPLVLGATLPLETVLAPRDARICPSNAQVTMSVSKRLAIDNLGFGSVEVSIANNSEQEAKSCLMPFSVLGSPQIYVEIENMKGELLLDALPEVYPVANEQVAFQVFTIPAKRSVLVRQAFFQQPRIEKGEKVLIKWRATLNHEVQSGTVTIDWP